MHYLKILSTHKKNSAFTLIEIIIAVVLLGIIAGFALPKYARSIEKGHARSARSNLIAIHSMLEIWNANDNSYPPTGAGDLAYLNTTLRLNIIDRNFSYTYTNTGGTPLTFTLDAQRSGGGYTLRVTEAIISDTNPSCQAGTCP